MLHGACEVAVHGWCGERGRVGHRRRAVGAVYVRAEVTLNCSTVVLFFALIVVAEPNPSSL